MSTKNMRITIRFYSVLAKKTGQDVFVNFSTVFEKYEKNKDLFKTLDLYSNGEGYRIKEVEKLNGDEGLLLRGSFVRFRTDIPTAGERTSDTEKQVQLDINHEIIEKVHWVLCTHNNQEYLTFQSSMHGGTVHAFIKYLNFSDTQVLYQQNDVFSQGSIESLLAGKVVKSVEFRVGAPRSKKNQPNPEDTWTSQALDFLKDGATIFEGKVSTRSTISGLAGDAVDNIKAMLGSPTTKKLKVRVSDIDEPIDLFGDRIKGMIQVPIINGVVNSSVILLEMQKEYVRQRNRFP